MQSVSLTGVAINAFLSIEPKNLEDLATIFSTSSGALIGAYGGDGYQDPSGTVIGLGIGYHQFDNLVTNGYTLNTVNRKLIPVPPVIPNYLGIKGGGPVTGMK